MGLQSMPRFFLQLFFKYAKHEVCIYSGRLFSGVFDSDTNVVTEAINFLRRDTDCILRIAISEKIDFSVFCKKTHLLPKY